jgi:hypothetical protein
VSIGYLGSKVARYLFLGVKYVLSRIFRVKNITLPLGILSKLILDYDLFSSTSQEESLAKINQEILKMVWTQTKS